VLRDCLVTVAVAPAARPHPSSHLPRPSWPSNVSHARHASTSAKSGTSTPPTRDEPPCVRTRRIHLPLHSPPLTPGRLFRRSTDPTPDGFGLDHDAAERAKSLLHASSPPCVTVGYQILAPTWASRTASYHTNSTRSNTSYSHPFNPHSPALVTNHRTFTD
jgi:hypothetical protein